MIIFSRPWLRVLSGLFINLSAAWFGAVFIVSSFTSVLPTSLLTLYLFYGIPLLLEFAIKDSGITRRTLIFLCKINNGGYIVSLAISINIEKELEKYG